MAEKQRKPRPPPIEGRCEVWIPQKNRYCKLPKTTNSRFCGPHATAESTTRVPCPLDPSHTVEPERLADHVKRCTGKLLSRAPELPCYKLDANRGSDHEGELPPDAPPVPLWADEALVFEVLSLARLASAGVPEPRSEFLACPEAEAADRAVFRSSGSRKHMPQLASLCAHLLRRGWLGSGPGALGHAFLELGAGKAHLSRVMAALCGDSASFVLVDRGKFNSRSEGARGGACEAAPAAGSRVTFERVGIDIKDLDVAALGPVRACGGRVLAFGKHLCGAACDLALRAVARMPAGSGGARVAVAMCCWHRCNWRDYAGRAYLRSLGFGPRAFRVLCGAAAWATLTKDAAAAAASGPMPFDERIVLGRAARRLLAEGRAQFLRSCGFENIDVVFYVPDDVSPENLLLLAERK
eukprot:m51a1_g13786 hypothetical protein (411) ;mRNA; r:329204-330515